MKKKITNLLGGLLFTMLMLCMFAGTVMAADELWINGKSLTASTAGDQWIDSSDPSCGKYAWNKAEHTLTLTDAVIKSTVNCITCKQAGAIHYNGTADLTINLKGTNKIILGAGNSNSGIVCCGSSLPAVTINRLSES